MDREFLLQLLDISRRMAETRELKPLLNYTMKMALALFNAERGYLVLAGQGEPLDFRVKIDRHGQELEHPEAQISSSILNKVIRQNQPLIINDAIFDPSFNAADSVRSLQLRSVMCAPLSTATGTVRGAIYVENRTNANIFEDRSMELLTFFAAQAAVAIENAVLNEDLEAQVAARTVELENAMAQIEHSWLEAVEANRLRTKILGNVAHDLRSPIAAAVSVLSALYEGMYGTMTEDQRNWIRRARQSLDHAVRLTRDVFDLTKAEEGRLEIYRVPTKLNDFLLEVFAAAELLPWTAGVDLEIDIEPELPKVCCDETRIQQVLINLLSNAQRFTKRGSVTLYARHLADEKMVLIGVRDTGSGIPPDAQEKLFQRFQQVSGDFEQRRRGSGLGLAICRELIERHFGQIGVRSEAGSGADFYFTLPLSEGKCA
jgi:signal transduction histidine kinase